jgi:KTSC domain
MNNKFTAPAAYSEKEYRHIEMVPVKSHQIAAIGYDAATKTLAVTFTRGTGAIYHYPNVEPKVHADFIDAESIGKYFGQHIKSLPFQKFKPLETA